MKIFVLDQFHPAGLDYLAGRADVIRWDDPRVASWRDEADALMVRMTPLTDDDFGQAKKLRLVVKQGVGVNTIDLAAAKRRGIAVCNTPGVNSEAVAEMALTLALAVSRRIVEVEQRIRAGETVNRANYLGLESWGKTVGVVGMGNIGTRIARKWRGAFEATILAYDPYVPATTWPDIEHERLASLDDLWTRADIVTLHVPLTDETQGLVGARELARMKPTAILINVSRGGIVDEAALYDALKAGRIFGAGLDVFDEEPPTRDNPLFGLPNFVGSPHAAGSTAETQAKSSLLVAQQVIEVMAGAEPLSRVA